MKLATYKLFNPLDDHYFPGYSYGPGPDDEDDPMLPDLQNAWVIGEGLTRRQPWLQRGAQQGPVHASEQLSDTERWLTTMGHELSKRIHGSPGSEYPLYRGMVVPHDFLSKYQPGSTLSLPLSSFDEDSSTAWSYATPQPQWDAGHEGKTGVLLHLPQGARSFPLIDTEHITHGDYDVTGVRPSTPDDLEELGGTSFMPTIMDIRQRNVPRPAVSQ
jgi:hypothetical protein